ncbi:MAG: hypothetical protein JNK65_08000 [Deltaproteobacteria bacterium]|nr:hypothetical protein [Deltaproteobacteria bacterium]
MRNLRDDQCGTVDVQSLIQNQQCLDENMQSAQMLSCGGVYLSPEMENTLMVPRYDVLHLSNHKHSFLILKNLKEEKRVLRHEEGLFDSSEQTTDAQPKNVLRKMMRDHLN